MSFPLVNYPSTLVWIDDDETILASARYTFNKPLQLKTFSSGANFLEFYKGYAATIEKYQFLRAVIEDEKFGLPENSPADVDYAALTALRDDPQKQNDISVIIVDYQMPNMTGLELCRKINNKNIKKILLTGELANEQIVDAFNDGLIDYYIKKSDAKLLQKLHFYINLFAEQYFQHQTAYVYKHLELKHSLPFSDHAVKNFVTNYLTEHNIKQHYLSDAYGTLEMINSENQKTYLVIYTEKRLEEFLELYSDNPKAASLLAPVRNRKMLPFFGDKKEAWQVEMSVWEQCLFPAEVVEGDNRYYVCICIFRF